MFRKFFKPKKEDNSIEFDMESLKINHEKSIQNKKEEYNLFLKDIIKRIESVLDEIENLKYEIKYEYLYIYLNSDKIIELKIENYDLVNIEFGRVRINNSLNDVLEDATSLKYKAVNLFYFEKHRKEIESIDVDIKFVKDAIDILKEQNKVGERKRKIKDIC